MYVERDKTAELFAKGGALAAGPDYSANIARRTGPGQVEVHDKETDIFYVVDGEATFVTGGRMIGGKLARPNQWLGTSIEGGETRQLKKGDFIVIPAGTASLVQGRAAVGQLLRGEGDHAIGDGGGLRASGFGLRGQWRQGYPDHVWTIDEIVGLLA